METATSNETMRLSMLGGGLDNVCVQYIVVLLLVLLLLYLECMSRA